MRVRHAVWLMALALAVSCRLSDIRTVTIKIPQVTEPAAQQVVREALVRTDGVLPDAIVFAPGAVTVSYDSLKVALKNLEHGITAAGFDANEMPADAKAREALPAACR